MKYIYLLIGLTLINLISSFTIDTDIHFNCSDGFLIATTQLIFSHAHQHTDFIPEFYQLSDDYCTKTKTHIVSPYIIHNDPVEYYRRSLIRLLDATSENKTITNRDVINAYNRSLDAMIIMLNNSDTIDSDELFVFVPEIQVDGSGVHLVDRVITKDIMITYVNNHGPNAFKVHLFNDKVFVNSIGVEWVKINKSGLSTDFGRLVYPPPDAILQVMKQNPRLNISGVKLITGPMYDITVSEERKLLWLMNKKIEYHVLVDPLNLETKAEKPWWYVLTG